jgi:cell division protein FtsI/penicillin-binding protein 2
MDRWSVFGKTGTAQIGGPGGYEDRAYTATFMAGAPASAPAVVCVISVYKPDYSRGYTGGTVAAPCVRQVLQKTLPYLDIPPDKNLVASN